jgi:hypothetical protein
MEYGDLRDCQSGGHVDVRIRPSKAIRISTQRNRPMSATIVGREQGTSCQSGERKRLSQYSHSASPHCSVRDLQRQRRGTFEPSREVPIHV